MPTISLRLTDKIEEQLSREAQLEGRARSEVVREAIVEYIERHERDRFMEEMVAAAKSLAADPVSQKEAREIAEVMVYDGMDPLITDERVAGIDPDEKWWR
jgi:metal-responsive CopG/Arc/MetJ family transcriptional regulator